MKVGWCRGVQVDAPLEGAGEAGYNCVHFSGPSDTRRNIGEIHAYW